MLHHLLSLPLDQLFVPPLLPVHVESSFVHGKRIIAHSSGFFFFFKTERERGTCATKHVASALQAAGGVAVGSGSGPSLTHDSVKQGE